MLPKISHVFRLSRDPEMRYAPDGTAICRVGLVASEKRRDKETQLWLDGTAFGKTAEFLHNVKKGQRVFVTGRLQTDNWTDNHGGRRSKTAFIIDNFEYIEKRDNGYGQQYGYQAQQTPPQVPVEHQDASGNVTGTETVPAAQDPHPKELPEIDIDEDDIPF